MHSLASLGLLLLSSGLLLVQGQQSGGSSGGTDLKEILVGVAGTAALACLLATMSC